MKKGNYPFPHFISDDFLTKDLFTEITKSITNANLYWDEKNQHLRADSLLDKNGNVLKNNGFSNDILKKIFYEINGQLLHSLKLLAPRKLPLYQFTEIRLQKAEQFYDSLPHTDSPEKLLSAVIYLHPEKEVGTKMYEDPNLPFCNICEWKLNRVFIFSRLYMKSWHSFESESPNGRFVISYNLMTEKTNLATLSEGIVPTLRYLFHEFFFLNLIKLKQKLIKLKNNLKIYFH